MEKYALQDHEYILIDKKIGLNLHLPFTLPKLSEAKPKEIYEKQFPSYTMRHLQKDDVMHGECIWLYPTKQIMHRCYYHEGHLHGPSCFYSLEGDLLSESWYVFGKKEGRVRQYYPKSLALYCELFFRDDKKVLTHQYFYEEGSMKMQMHYCEDQLHGETLIYWPNQQIKRSLFYQEGKKHGWDRIYHENGVLLDEGFYEYDIAKGHHRRWNERENLIEEILYEEDFTQWKRYNEKQEMIYEKVVSSEMSFEKEKEEGKWVKRVL